MDALFALARELASSRTWSAGVELARNADFQEEPTTSEDERNFRVIRGPRDRVLRVSLSEASEMWQCDCGQEEDPCPHVIATIIAVRQGSHGRGLVRSTTALPGSIVHAFIRQGRTVAFSRWLVWEADRVEVKGSLSSAIEAAASKGGITKRVTASREELQIDHVLGNKKEGVLEPRTMRLLIPALSRVSRVEIDGAVILASPDPITTTIVVTDEGDSVRVRRASDPKSTEIFDNGVVIRDGMLCGVEDSSLSAQEISLIAGEGTLFSRQQRVELASRILPILEGKVRVDNRSTNLPRARRVAPRIELETISNAAGDQLTVVPHLVYGRPAIAEIRGNIVEQLSRNEIPIRDPIEEAQLARELLAALHLKLNEARVFSGEAAVRFVERMDGWDVYGGGAEAFTPADDLKPTIVVDGSGTELRFQTVRGDRSISAEDVLKAWRSGGNFVPLLGGGWGTLPKEWLREHLDVIERLLAARRAGEANAARLLPDIAEICDSLGTPCPEYFTRLREALKDITTIPVTNPPEGLTAQLRPYQQLGISWLAFLRKNNLGALLADDMGLGKTLQAICTIPSRTDPSQRYRTLVVAPTSVLYSWRDQIKRFRPGLSICLYHGPNRTFDTEADVVITTYALLRLDRDLLESEEWAVIILDEAQIIRNPDSQVARSAYKLRGDFKISLSGTPVENSLNDLWSQFHFINPGLLGTRGEFEERFANPIRDGDTRAIAGLRQRVQPFMLRRLKREVAADLPPKTEVVLECELSDHERRIYEGILGASRAEIVQRLSDGEGIFAALEVLLRLRQACCHPALLPGIDRGSPDSKHSSKLELLRESLEASIAQGHRALVFSQWTSLLDLVEPLLTASTITFSRIDGSTPDRAQIVDAFQQEDGPQVMLLSLKAGGLGLTLTAADHVYILDPWWNPAAEDQAGDRAHRIGQENPVIVHRLVAIDTIEERILELQARKRSLLEAAVGEGGEVTLTRDEVLALLG